MNTELTPEQYDAVCRAAKAAMGWILPEDEWEDFWNDRTDREGLKQKLAESIYGFK